MTPENCGWTAQVSGPPWHGRSRFGRVSRVGSGPDGPQPSISATIARSSVSSLLVTAILDFANSSIAYPSITS